MKRILRFFEDIWWLVRNQPYGWTEFVVGIVIPLTLVGMMFAWRVQQSLKKKTKQIRRREKLLKRLQASRNDDATSLELKSVEDEEEEDEVVAKAIRQLEQKAKKLN